MKRRDFLKSALFFSVLPIVKCSSNKTNNLKVVLLGFDGANWQTLDPLFEKGKLQFLKKLRDNSAWASFKTYKPAKSNVIWTSIATGKHMLKHGIMDFSYLRNNGIKVPYRKSKLKEPTIWEIINKYNKGSVVINWWVSHPPDKIEDIKISDEFRNVLTKDDRFRIRYKNTVYPKNLFRLFTPFIQNNRDLQKVLKKIGVRDFVKDFQELYPQGNFKKIPVLSIYRTLIRQDSLIEEISYYLFRKYSNVDLFFTYFRFPDIIQHFATHFIDKCVKQELFKYWENNSMLNYSDLVIKKAYESVSDILLPAYEYMEKIIKNIFDMEKNKNTYFFILSDHGFNFYPGGYNHFNLPDEIPAPDGIFLLNGPNVRKGYYKDINVMDIVPNMLYLMDLPIGKRMDGKIQTDLFNFSRRIRYGTYRKNNLEKIRTNKDMDKRAMDELKSMGYI